MKFSLFALVAFVFTVNSFACYNDHEFSYCTGDSVINDKGLKGRIAAVFPSGEVSVAYNGYDGFNKWPTSRLGVTHGCADRAHCVGQVVINDKGLRGKIEAVYPDHDVAVSFDGYDGSNKWPVSRLANTDACAYGKHYCVGQDVINDKGLRGRVSAILPSGGVMVGFNGYDGYNEWPTDRLAVTKGCTRDDYCVSDRIISDTGLPGHVAGILRNGQVMVAFDGYDGYNEWPTSRLGITNACSDRSIILK